MHTYSYLGIWTVGQQLKSREVKNEKLIHTYSGRGYVRILIFFICLYIKKVQAKGQQKYVKKNPACHQTMQRSQ